jgi:uncharacterized protein YdaU (DUF1376 family)
MPLYVADYLADTAHLTAAQSGAYLHLIMAYWRAGGPLRLSDDALARAARMTPDEWIENRDAVLAFFAVSSGQIRHGRIDHELAEAARLYDARKRRTEAATAARAARNVTDNVTMNVTSDVTDNVTYTQPQPQPQPPFPSERTSSEKPVLGGAGGKRAERADRGTRLPDEWSPSEDDRAFAGSLGVAVEREAASFRDYWHSKPGADGRKTNWSATWRNWVRRSSERKQGNGTGSRTERNGFIVHAERLAREDTDRAAGRSVVDFLDAEDRG